MITIYIAILAVILYLTAGIKLGLRLSRGSRGQDKKFFTFSLGYAAILLHAVVLYQRLFVFNASNLGFFNALSLLAWLVALLLLSTALFQPIENLGIAILPLAAVALLLGLIFPSHHFVSNDAAFGLEMHIVISILAYSLYSIASVQAILLAIQDRHLHNKRPGGFIRTLPPMETMETLMFHMIAVAFLLHTVSLITGFMYLKNMFTQHMVHKTVLSIAAWGVFAVLLVGRWRHGWRAQTAIRWTLSGFVTLVLAYLGSKLVLEIFLGR